MMNLDFHNNWGPMTILAFITILNVSLIISFLTGGAGSSSFIPGSIQFGVLIGLEFGAAALAYLISKHSKVIAAL